MEASRILRRGRGVLLATLCIASVALAEPSPTLGDGTVTRVQVERVRPAREKLATLRFLKANRDFIRARFDRLRQESREAAAGAGALDPRFLRYRELLTQVNAAKDSVTTASDARERQGLFQSVSDLASLERELDQMERLLDAQRARLGVLQHDFAGRQRTELNLLVTGAPVAGTVDSVALTLEDGTRVVAGLDGTQRDALKHGAVFEVFRGLVEPREQVFEVALIGTGWSDVGHGYVTLEPGRDRLTFLQLDLAQANPARGINSLIASSWRFEPTSDSEASGLQP